MNLNNLQINMNWIDKTVGFFSPKLAYERARYRAATSILERNFHGASRKKRVSGWNPVASGPNQQYRGQLTTLRSRSRDLVNNNPYANKGIGVIQTNLVGKGITGTVSAKKNQEEWQELWKKWANSINCDVKGELNLYGLQALAMREIAESGECLIRRRFTKKTGSIPLEIQILQADYIDTLKDGYISNGENSLVQGIEINKLGRKVAYHLYREHPNDAPLFGTSLDSTRIDAKEIIHLLRVDRAGQLRGVPWLAPVMVKMRDFDEYEDAQLIRQKIAACFSGFIHDSDPSAISNGASKDDLSDFYSKKITPATFEILPPGKSIEFTKPPEVTGYDEYTKVVLRSIAAGLGVTYESLTCDLSNVNFSSGRMGWLEFQRNLVSWRETIMINNFCYRIFEWFKEAAYLIGLDADKDSVSIEWKPPRREMIDPTREIPAIRDAIRSGLLSYKTAVLEMGYDPMVLVQEIDEYNKVVDSKEIILDSDPRKTNISGSTQKVIPDE